MDAIALPEKFHNQALLLNVKEIHLSFSGGSDEGYLDVRIDATTTPENKALLYQLEQDVEAWAWEVYDYSGAGDGTDYGDDITYSIERKCIITQDWYMERKYNEEQISTMLVDGTES